MSHAILCVYIVTLNIYVSRNTLCLHCVILNVEWYGTKTIQPHKHELEGME